MSEFWHSGEFCVCEDRSVATSEIRAYNASSAYSHSALENSFKADLDVTSFLQSQVVDHFHHGLWPTSIDGVEIFLLKNMFRDLWNLVLLPVGSVVGGEYELEVVFFALPREPVLEEEFAGRSGTCNQGYFAAPKMNEERDEGNESRSASHDEEFVMVTDMEGSSVRTPDPEAVAHLPLPENLAYRPALLDDNPRLNPPVYGQDTHWDLVYSWDPYHGELAWFGVVKAGVAEPEGTDGGSLVLNSLKSNRPRSMKQVRWLFQD